MPRRPSLAARRQAAPTQDSDHITKEDMAIFKLGAANANYFSDFYMRSPTSGTYWRNSPLDAMGELDTQRQRGWETLRNAWERGGQPEPDFVYGAEGNQIVYIVQRDEHHNPVFYHRHGVIWQPWQLAVHHAPQPEITIVGGFACGKTLLAALSLATLAATIPYFRGFAVAPQMLQAMEVYNYIKTNLADTPYWKRWIVNYPTKPYPKFVIRNSYVGESTIEMLSIEKDPEKVRTLEGDILFLDQTEKFDDLDDILRDAGTRLRGAVKGRPKLGKMIWSANAGDNPQLWYRYDMQEHEPKYYRSFNPRSRDNPHLSENDLRNLRRRVSADANEEEIEQWMEGKRPMGAGEHFSRTMIRNCTNEGINDILKHALALPDGDPRRDGFALDRADSLGLYHFEIPPDHHLRRDYIVISDPGSGDPPKRNSAPVMVFDVTEFPEKRMRMVAFTWVFGRGSYWPWIFEHERYVKLYQAQGRNAFDATGVQKGFDELIFRDMGLAAEGMNMAGSGKMLALNSLKFFMGKGMIEFPYIAHLSNQLANYRLPDEKISQDLVMCLAMAAGWARRLYIMELDDDREDVSRQRVPGQVDRYDRASGDRYSRPTTQGRT